MICDPTKTPYWKTRSNSLCNGFVLHGMLKLNRWWNRVTWLVVWIQNELTKILKIELGVYLSPKIDSQLKLKFENHLTPYTVMHKVYFVFKVFPPCTHNQQDQCLQDWSS
jgi:hypothetical protein